MLNTQSHNCFSFNWRPSSSTLSGIKTPQFSNYIHFQSPFPSSSSASASSMPRHAPVPIPLLRPSDQGRLEVVAAEPSVASYAMSEMAASQMELLDDISILDIDEDLSYQNIPDQTESGEVDEEGKLGDGVEQRQQPTPLQRFLEDETDSDVRVHSIPTAPQESAAGEECIVEGEDLQMIMEEDELEDENDRLPTDQEAETEAEHNNSGLSLSRRGSLLDRWRKKSVTVGWRSFGGQDVLGDLTDDKRKRKRQTWDLE